jgi:hypothetical protein
MLNSRRAWHDGGSEVAHPDGTPVSQAAHTRTATITTATRRTGRVRRPTRTRDGAAGPDIDGSGPRAAMPTARRPGQPRQVRGQGQDRSTRAAGHCFRRAARAVRWLGDNGSPPTTRTPPPKFGLNDSRCRGLVDGGQGFLEHLGRVAARPGGHVVHSGCGDVESSASHTTKATLSASHSPRARLTSRWK